MIVVKTKTIGEETPVCRKYLRSARRANPRQTVQLLDPGSAQLKEIKEALQAISGTTEMSVELGFTLH